MVSHGKKVALGTIVSETLYDRLLAYPVDELDIEGAVAAWPAWPDMERHIRNTHDHPMVVQKALEECRAKYISPAELRERLTRFRQAWPELKDRLRAQLLPLPELNNLLRDARCPTLPGHIGLGREQMRESYLAAGQIRRRYTVFDLVHEAGLLRGFVDDLFSPEGYWSTVEDA
jgi:glycerol-1-phosphate dehydrogenase [NAD(P)+]